MKTKLIIAGAIALSLTLSVGAALAVNERFGKTDTTTRTVGEAVHGIIIEADAGDVRLYRGGPRVELTETREYVFAAPRVTHAVDDGVLRVRSSCNRVLLFDCSTHFRIRVPTGVAVTTETSAGDIHAAGLDTRDIRAKSDAGDIRLDVGRLPDRVEAVTSAGDVHVTVPRATYAVEADTDAGETGVHGIVQDEWADRTIRARSDAGDVSIDAR